MEFKKVVLLGGGVLGAQIALMSAYTEHDTTIWMRSEGSIERTKPKLERYSKLMLKSLEDSKALIGNPIGAHRYPRALIKDWDNITEEKIDELIAKGEKNMDEKMHLELDLAKALEGADIVIETMSENEQAKIDVYTKIKDMMDEKTILVTNTSNMLPSTFAEYTGRPEKYMALHFANEIWANNTAECMGHEGTSQETYDAVVRFAEEINMIPIKLHKEQAHYVLNSMLNPFLASALELWGKDVADPETIDKTWRLATGAPAGPFQIIDVVGLNTVYNSVALTPGSQDPDTVLYQVAKKLKEKIDKGEIGINVGKGFYTYEDNDKALL
jgi:3-hydroxyacyl-CoA dehydrogenase